MRRVLASLSSAAFVLGLLVGVAPGAQAAASPSSITLGYSGGQYALSSETLSAVVGDTFVFNNDVNQSVKLRNGTGSISIGGTSCIGDDCTISADPGPGDSETVRVDALGTFSIVYSSSMTVTIVGSSGESGSAATDPALVYPTLYLNPNGGTCTGTMQFTKYNGQNNFVILPTAATCTRSGYTLLGWSQGINSVFMWRPGMLLSIGDESFTLDASWRANGLLVTYYSNVGMDTECVKDGVNLSTGAERSVTRVITNQSEGEALAWDGVADATWTTAVPAPVCSPPGYEFLGWSASPSGPTFRPSETMLRNPSSPVPFGSFSPGTDIPLYAQWGLTWGVQMAATSQQLTPGGTATLTVTALRNGSADAGAPRQLRIVDSGGAVSLFSPFIPPAARTSQFRTDGEGTFSIPIYASQTPGTGSITASYGNATQTLEFTVGSPQPPSIVITGERTTINGSKGVRIEGTVTGIPEGTPLVPWMRFPGDTDFLQMSDQPTIESDGSFSWEYKTSLRVTVYFTGQDGNAVKSNRVSFSSR